MRADDHLVCGRSADPYVGGSSKIRRTADRRFASLFRRGAGTRLNTAQTASTTPADGSESRVEIVPAGPEGLVAAGGRARLDVAVEE